MRTSSHYKTYCKSLQPLPNTLTFSRNMNNIFKKDAPSCYLYNGQILSALYREKFFFTELSVFKYFSFIGKRQINSGIKVSQITQTRSQNIKFINYIRKISASGLNVIVPVSSVVPITSTSCKGFPHENSCIYIFPLRFTSARK